MMPAVIMEIFNRNKTRIKRAKDNNPPSSSDTFQETHQSDSFTLSSQRTETRYRACPGETYQLAELPKDISRIPIECSAPIKLLNDRDTVYSNFNDCVQIDTTPRSTPSLSSLENTLDSPADLKKNLQIFRAVDFEGHISLLPIGLSTKKQRAANAKDTVHEVQGILLKLASEDPEMFPVIVNALGLDKGWGTGPNFDKSLFSVFDPKLLQHEIVAGSNSGSTELKTYAVGFDTKVFSRMFLSRCRATNGVTFNHGNNCFKRAKICPYLVLATQEVFQTYMDTILVPRRSAYGELCERLHPHSADQRDPGLEFKQVAGCFFSGKEVPKDFTFGHVENTNSFRITHHVGDRTKVLDMKPIEDHTLVIFLEDCIMSNDLAFARSKNLKRFGMEIIQDHVSGYGSIINAEATTGRFTLLSSDHASEDASDDKNFGKLAGKGVNTNGFARANMMKKLLNQIPRTLENIPSSEADSLQSQDIAQGSELPPLNALGITGLDISNGATVSEGGAVSKNKTKKPKKKKAKKTHKEFVHSHEAPGSRESNSKEPSVLENVAGRFSGQTFASECNRTSTDQVSQDLLIGREDEPEESDVSVTNPEIWTKDGSCNRWETVQLQGNKRKELNAETVMRDAQMSASIQRKSSKNLAQTDKRSFAVVVAAPFKSTALSNDHTFSFSGKDKNNFQSSTDSETAIFNTKNKAKEPPPEQSFDEKFPPLSSMLSKQDMEGKKLIQKSGPVYDLPKTGRSKQKFAVDLPPVVELGGISHPDQSVKFKGSSETPQKEKDLAIDSPAILPATHKRGKGPRSSEKLTSVNRRQSAPTKDLQRPSSRNPKIFGSKKSAEEPNFVSLSHGVTTEDESSTAGGKGNDGQNTCNIGRKFVNAASETSTTAKIESTTNQVRSSALSDSETQLSLQSWKRTELVQQVESKSAPSLKPDLIMPNGPRLDHDLYSKFNGQPSETRVTAKLLEFKYPASPILTGVPTDDEQNCKIESDVYLSDTMHILKPEGGDIMYTSRGDGNSTPPRSISGSTNCKDGIIASHNFIAVCNDSQSDTKHENNTVESVRLLDQSELEFGFTGVDKKAETSIFEEPIRVKQKPGTVDEPLSPSTIEDTVGAQILSDPLAWANLSERIKPCSRRYSLETGQSNFSHEILSTSFRSQSEEPKDRIPLTTLESADLMIQRGNKHDFASDHIPALSISAPGPSSYKELQQEADLHPRNSSTFSTLRSASQIQTADYGAMTFSMQAPIQHPQNPLISSSRFHNKAFSYAEYQGSENYLVPAGLHVHPMPDSTFPLGNSHYLPPSSKDPALNVTRSMLKYNLGDWNCTFCRVKFHPSAEHPANFCPFCIDQGVVVYCSTSCQLTDSYDHCATCQHNPSYERLYTQPITPTATYRIENYPTKGQSYSPAVPECYRQKAFSMFCRTGKFPDLMGTWNSSKLVRRNSVDISDSSKHVGDYFIFRSALTSPNQAQAPVDVICAITLDPMDAMKLPLRRMLNACYVQPTPYFTRFLFRFLRHLVTDYNIFCFITSVTAYAPHRDIVCEFNHQFAREFSFPVENQNDQEPFAFRPEWECISPILERFERENKLLEYWKMRDLGCQLYWKYA